LTGWIDASIGATQMTAPTGKALAMKLHLQEYGHAPPLIAPTEATLIVSGIAAATTLDLQHTKFKSFAFGMLTATPDCKPNP
jgi:pyruvate/2-oxoacid:ferredoxin oxidoreductase beta subunit